jgi:hypothetical protein
VSQIKEQIEAIGDTIEEVKLVMTTLNGLPKSRESFIQGICSRRKLTKFSRLWEDCTQEESRLVAREEKLGNDDQALAVHARKGKRIIPTISFKGHESLKRITLATNAITVER